MTTTRPNRATGGDGVSVDLPPLRNGVDYLRRVVTELDPGEGQEVGPLNLKHAVLHLHAATEVLLKYRLQLEHWTLVLERVDRKHGGRRVTPAMFRNGQFKSCGLEEARLRLDQVARVQLSDETKSIDALIDMRNAVQHYGLTAEGRAEKTTAEVLHLLISFLHAEVLNHPKVQPEEREQVEEDLRYVGSSLRRIDRYVAYRLKQLEPALAPHPDQRLTCPYCRTESLLAMPDSVACLFCPESSMDIYWTAAAYASDVLRLDWRSQPTSGPFSQPAQPPVDDCPVCGKTALVRGALTHSSPTTPCDFCFNCGQALSGPAAI
ncbi:hypothetical protein [Streptomyces globisporus]|uniref:hypothetical protein n=1 Tax=Streptomyces globisporus TaxID=1908 RepID=UPI001B354702